MTVARDGAWAEWAPSGRTAVPFIVLLVIVVGLFYVVSAVIATQGSTAWNFFFTERWVFAGRDHRRGRGTRLAMFFLMNNVALALRGPLLVLLGIAVSVEVSLIEPLSLELSPVSGS